MAEIVFPDSKGLTTAAALLKRSGVVGIPTETVYGLAAIVFDTEALARVFSIKERPTFDPLIVHVSPALLQSRSQPHDSDALEALARLGLVAPQSISQIARKQASALIKAFWPGPLTLVLPKDPQVPDLATSGLDTVGLRMPKHHVAQALIDSVDAPLAAPSANRFGRISPTTVAAVQAELGDRIELIVDGGPSEVGLESTVVSVRPDGQITLLRPGAVTREEISRVSGRNVLLPSKGASGIAAPGMLESHYAPRSPLVILPSSLRELASERVLDLAGRVAGRGGTIALLLMSGDPEAQSGEFSRLTGATATAISLSHDGRLEDIARNLFAGMRQLDERQPTLILAEPPPTRTGLGHAISDRLERAAASTNT